MLRLLLTPNLPPEEGWIAVATPLGASAHVQINSAAHELCDDWRILSTGRMQLISHTNFGHWFGPLFESVPIGLVAELLMANGMRDHFTALVVTRSEARAHIQSIPDCCHGLDEEEWQLLGEALDIVRILEVRVAARAAAQEALRA